MKTIDASTLFLFADSAMGRDAMPLFIPDGQWRADVRLAVRIGRLGKNISEKFALRYVDAISLVAVACPSASDSYPSWLAIMDNAVTAGHWQTFQLGECPDVAEGEVRCGDDALSATYSGLQSAVAAAVAKVSALATLKTGDVILLDYEPLRVILKPDTRIDAKLDEQCLALKVK